MAFDVTPMGLWREIHAAEAERDKRLAVLSATIEAYTSPFWKSESGEISDALDYNPENHHYEFLRLHVPQILSGMPRAMIKSKRAAPHDAAHDLAKGLQHAANVWAVDTDLEYALLPCAFDFYLNHCVGLVRQQAHPYLALSDGGAAAEWPQFVRVSPRRFVRDPLALSRRECRFFGHMTVIDKDDLLATAEEEGQEGWDEEAIGALAEMRPDDGMREGRSDVPDRKEVTYYELWMPELETEGGAGYHGTILTLGVGTTSDGTTVQEFIREPRGFWGPPDGPYEVADQYVVPDEPYGLAGLVATEGEVRDLNSVVRGAILAGNSYKRLILVDDTDPDFVAKVSSGEFDLVLPVAGLGKDRVIAVEIGGITPQMIALIQDRRDRLDRVSGMSEARRGLVTGRGTATEVAEAAQSGDIAIAYDKRQWMRFVRGVFSKATWYIAHSKNVRIALNAESSRELGIETPPGGMAVYEGGDWDLKAGDWSAAQLEIEPLSMEYTSQAQLQQMALMAHQIKVADLQAMIQFPVVEFWRKEYERLGDMMNLPGFADEIETVVQMAAAMQGMQQQVAPPQYPSVRLGGGSGYVGRPGGSRAPQAAAPRAAAPRAAAQGAGSPLAGPRAGARARLSEGKGV